MSEILTQIPEDVASVLARATVTGNCLVLPPGQLERKLYEKTNKVLEQLGGKWNRGKKAHVFAGDPNEKLQQVLQSGQIAFDAKNGFFETPRQEVDHIIALAELKPEHLVLEPSAGKGAIADGAAEIVAKDRIYCCEQNDDRAEVLRLKGYMVWRMDFAEFNMGSHIVSFAGFDRVLMNPPFQNLAAKHILRAYDMLKPGGRLVAICSRNIRYRMDKAYDQVRSIASSIEDLPEGTFLDAGTPIDTCILVANKPEVN